MKSFYQPLVFGLIMTASFNLLNEIPHHFSPQRNVASEIEEKIDIKKEIASLSEEISKVDEAIKKDNSTEKRKEYEDQIQQLYKKQQKLQEIKLTENEADQAIIKKDLESLQSKIDNLKMVVTSPKAEEKKIEVVVKKDIVSENCPRTDYMQASLQLLQKMLDQQAQILKLILQNQQLILSMNNTISNVNSQLSSGNANYAEANPASVTGIQGLSTRDFIGPSYGIYGGGPVNAITQDYLGGQTQANQQSQKNTQDPYLFNHVIPLNDHPYVEQFQSQELQQQNMSFFDFGKSLNFQLLGDQGQAFEAAPSNPIVPIAISPMVAI